MVCKATVVVAVAGMLLAACASPTPEPPATLAVQQVPAEPTAAPLPTSTAVPSATASISPANEGCVRATTEIPEGQNPTGFTTSGPASGCYDNDGDFLDDIGLSWQEFLPGTAITFWTEWPVDSSAMLIPPTPAPLPTSPATPSPMFVRLGSPFPPEWGTPLIWSNDSFNGAFDSEAIDDNHGHVDISVPAGYSVFEGFDVHGHTGDVRAPVEGMVTTYELGLEVTLPNNTYPDGVLEALAFAGIEDASLQKISRVVLDLGHVKQIRAGWAAKGAAIAEIEPFNDRVGQTKVGFQVFIWYDGVEYAFTPSLFGLDIPWDCFPDSPYDCVPEAGDYAPR